MQDILEDTLISVLEDPPCEFRMLRRESGLSICISSLAEVNRRLPKNLLVILYRKGKLLRCNNDRMPEQCLPYELLVTDLVIDLSNKDVLTLKELIKKHGATAVHGFKSFPEDKVPSVHEASEGNEQVDKPLLIPRSYQKTLHLRQVGHGRRSFVPHRV